MQAYAYDYMLKIKEESDEIFWGYRIFVGNVEYFLVDIVSYYYCLTPWIKLKM